jgi:hypothetical protein
MRWTAVLSLVAASVLASPPAPPLPRDLEGTGLAQVATIAFKPRYPLWSDGTTKRRWLHLPAGTSIDASKPDAWEFPPGTKAWKEFSHGARVETRLIERLADGSWRYASYRWKPDGTAELAPEEGMTLAIESAPGGRYTIPSRADCVACHEGASVPILGFGAVQLSAELPALSERGVVRGLPAVLRGNPPRVAGRTAKESEVLGYLHGNCGHCHNEAALPALGLVLAQEAANPSASAARALASLVGHESRFRAAGQRRPERVVPGHPEASVLVARMRSKDPLVRMPPIGVELADAQGLARLEDWIRNELH